MNLFNHTTLSNDEIKTLWMRGNNAGNGFSVGEETDIITAIDGIGEIVSYDYDIAVYQDGDSLVAVADAHGPWAVKIA